MAKKIITQKDEIIPHSYLKSHIATSRLEAPRPIEQMIYTLRDVQVILDEDIAGLYSVKTKRLNEQVKRNIERFESDFMFKLTAEEFAILKSTSTPIQSLDELWTTPYLHWKLIPSEYLQKRKSPACAT